MLRFLRRVFVILVLLIVVFVIFRIVNPTGTARFVDKVKTIPQTISGWFHHKADDTKNVVIDWIDTVLTWDIAVSKWKKKDKDKNNDKKNDKNVVDNLNTEQNVSDEDIYSWWDSINDFVRLENLNRETENKLWLNSGKNIVVVSSWCETAQCKKIEQDLKELAREVDKLKTSISGLNEKIESNTGNIVFVELKNEDTNTNPGNNTQSNTVQNNTPTTSQTTTKTTTKKRTNCCDANCVLSESECAEANMIWNLFQ